MEKKQEKVTRIKISQSTQFRADRKVRGAPVFKKGIDVKINPLLESLLPKNWREIKTETLLEWLKKHKDTLKIFKTRDGSEAHIFKGENSLMGYLGDLWSRTDFDYSAVSPSKQRKAFVHPHRKLTPEEIEEYRSFGLIPKGKREPTKKLKLTLDMKTWTELENVRNRYNKALALNLNKSEMIRLMILEGLRAISEDGENLEAQGQCQTRKPENQ
jgi:hypothetical protein